MAVIGIYITMVMFLSNKINILKRILLLPIIVILLYLIIKKGIIDGHLNHEKGIGILFFMIILFTFLFIAIVRSLFQVLKVQINTFSGEITLTKLFSTFIIYKDDIAGYYTEIYKGGTKTQYGLLLTTVNNQSFRLTEQNLKLESIEALKEFFEQENLKYLGEKTPFIP